MMYPLFMKKLKHNLSYSIKKSLYNNHLFLDWSKSMNNFGDILNPYLIGHISKKTIINVSAKYCYYPHLQAIGSIINRSNFSSTIWGSGYISSDSSFIAKPKNIYAVRGPLTRDLLIHQGVNCPEVYGDPALLLSKFYNPKLEKKYKIGILPHYADKNHPWLSNIDHESVKIIDIQNPNPLKVIDEINCCESIATSSLHGLIISDSYQIPSVWIKFSENITGGNFKFEDYFRSINSKSLNPLIIEKNTNIDEISQKCEVRTLNIDLDLLLDHFPNEFL